MPPVTTLPLKGSLLQIFCIYGGILSSKVVTVADSQFVLEISVQNLSGCPNSSFCIAIFLHNSQQAPSPFWIVKSGAVFWSPSIAFSVQLPFVTKTKSFTVSGIVSSFPLWMQTISLAIFFFPSISNNTLVTFVSYWIWTPWLSKYFTIGKIKDSYWLYFVNLRAEKSGNPPIWWINLWIYSFISRALCQVSKANIVLQYNQKFEAKNSSVNTSLIVLSYKSSSLVINNFIISIDAFSDKPNLPSVWASSPLLTVALINE